MASFFKNLFSPLEAVFIASLFSFMLGVMTALSAKYPVEVASLDEAQKICLPSQAKIVRSKLTGEVNYVLCRDGRSFQNFDLED